MDATSLQKSAIPLFNSIPAGKLASISDWGKSETKGSKQGCFLGLWWFLSLSWYMNQERINIDTESGDLPEPTLAPDLFVQRMRWMEIAWEIFVHFINHGIDIPQWASLIRCHIKKIKEQWTDPNGTDSKLVLLAFSWHLRGL